MSLKRRVAASLPICMAIAFLLSIPAVIFTADGAADQAVVTGGSGTDDSELRNKVRKGKYPAQLAGHSGNIQPGRYGPAANDPVTGIPKHAYSPFDEKKNREYLCPPGGCEFVEDRVAIKFAPQVKMAATADGRAQVEDSAINRAFTEHGIIELKAIFPAARAVSAAESVVSPDGVSVPKPDLSKWHRATLQQGKSVYSVIEALQAEAGVEWVEPVYVRRPVESRAGSVSAARRASSAGAANDSFSDPLYSLQWHLDAANVPDAWQWLRQNGFEPGGNRDIIVAVIDTGVDYSHPDLAANIWTNSGEIAGNGVDDDGDGFIDDVHGVNVVSNDWSESGDPMDDHGHGTHVAGIIAAQANNGLGGVGVAYNTQIMAIKAAQYSGILTTTDIAEGIYYAVEHGADVINMSFGGYTRSQVEEDALTVAFGQAVLVAAAGNDGKVNLPCPYGRDMYPAAYNWVLGVMASGAGGGRASFSNYDCTPHDSHEYELLAPGVDVWSALPGENYAAWDGTSMSTPIVAGMAALLRTKWQDKDVYSSRFIMGQIAANAAPLADAYAALTAAPKPELKYLEHWVFDTSAQGANNDDDGIVDAGETIELAIVIRNHWCKADPATVKLEALAAGASQPDPYVSMAVDTVDYGAVGSFNQDDNGLIYDDEGVITGVRNPFRFTVSTDCPNDHVIPFLLTMTARNGLDPTDTTDYTFQSRFYLIVQRGRELPRIISGNMTLTKDDYWILSDQTLIESGASLTITEGTQLQFFTADPNDPYGQDAHPFLQVEGNLYVEGTAPEPIEIFPSALRLGYPITILQRKSGSVELRYAKINNPNIGYLVNYSNGQDVSDAKIIDLIDHCYFTQDIYHCIYRYYDNYDNYYCEPQHNPVVYSASIRNSIFDSLGSRKYNTEGFLLPEFEVSRHIECSILQSNLDFMRFCGAKLLTNHENM